MKNKNLPIFYSDWKEMDTKEGVSLMTPIALVEGEVLNYLEANGSSTLKRIIEELKWPAVMILMGIGALIRGGLVRAKKIQDSVLLEVLLA